MSIVDPSPKDNNSEYDSEYMTVEDADPTELESVGNWDVVYPPVEEATPSGWPPPGVDPIAGQ